MKTDELITLLASSVQPVAARQVERRQAIALGCGLLLAAWLMLHYLGLRPDLAAAAVLPMFWIKLVFPAALLAGAWFATLRLSRPGVRLGRVPVALAAPVVVIWLLAIAALMRAAPADFNQLVYGVSWTVCPIIIAILSGPLFVALLWAIKGAAPTRLALAGAAAGLLAGAGGALVYALHCPEMGAPFLGIWYVLGMLIPAAFGALAGPWLLRW